MQTGTPLHAMSPLCKLLWLRQEQPDVFQQAHKFVSVKEYIFNRLFDRYVVDEGIAVAARASMIFTTIAGALLLCSSPA